MSDDKPSKFPKGDQLRALREQNYLDNQARMKAAVAIPPRISPKEAARQRTRRDTEIEQKVRATKAEIGKRR